MAKISDYLYITMLLKLVKGLGQGAILLESNQGSTLHKLLSIEAGIIIEKGELELIDELEESLIPCQKLTNRIMDLKKRIL